MTLDMGQTTPEPMGEPGPDVAAAADTTATTVDTPVVEKAWTPPANWDRMMAEELGDIGLPDEEQAPGEGEEAPAEDVDDAIETPPVTAGQVFKSKVQVFGEEMEVDLSGDELKAVVQKGLAFDRKFEKVEQAQAAKVEEALTAERERYQSDPYNKPEHREYLRGTAEFNAIAKAVFDAHPEFKEDFNTLAEEVRHNAKANVERVQSVFKPNAAASPDDKPMTRAEFKAWQESQKAEQAKTAEIEEGQQKLLKDASDFREKHPRVDIKAVAKVLVEKHFDTFDDAYAFMRGKNLIANDGKPAPVTDVAKGVAQNKAVVRIPAGQGNVGGPEKEPPPGTPAEEVRAWQIRNLKAKNFNAAEEIGM